MSGPAATVSTPPLTPVSAQDIDSFTALSSALRAHPELSREGANILNAKELAKLVDGIRTFQNMHLGRASKSSQYPLVRIPDEIFRDRSRSGPLFTALLAAFRQKKDSSWRHFDFKLAKRHDDNIALVKRMENELITAGFLTRPAIYFDETVPRQRKKELEIIVDKFGGTVVTDPKDVSVSHVVAYDPEFDLEADILQEERKEDEGEEPEKVYLRTLAVVHPTAEAKKNKKRKSEGDGDDELIPMALVHWWYWPASYDEWMPANDVAGEGENEPPPCPPGGPWVVGCKFVRDVARFNEWGSEADYAILDYEKKVALYMVYGETQQHVPKKKSDRKSPTAKKSSKTTKLLKKSEIELVDDVNTLVPLPFPSSNFRPVLARSNAIPLTIAPTKRDRRDGEGLNPRQILTGFYGLNGSRLRRTVYDGALRMPPYVLGIVHDAIKELSDGNAEYLLPPPATQNLLGVDSVLRPSIDPSLGDTLLVTEVSATNNGGSLAQNCKIPILKVTGEHNSTKRIRGGCGDAEMLEPDELSPEGTIDDTSPSSFQPDSSDITVRAGDRAVERTNPANTFHLGRLLDSEMGSATQRNIVTSNTSPKTSLLESELDSNRSQTVTTLEPEAESVFQKQRSEVQFTKSPFIQSVEDDGIQSVGAQRNIIVTSNTSSKISLLDNKLDSNQSQTVTTHEPETESVFQNQHSEVQYTKPPFIQSVEDDGSQSVGAHGKEGKSDSLPSQIAGHTIPAHKSSPTCPVVEIASSPNTPVSMPGKSTQDVEQPVGKMSEIHQLKAASSIVPERIADPKMEPAQASFTESVATVNMHSQASGGNSASTWSSHTASQSTPRISTDGGEQTFASRSAGEATLSHLLPETGTDTSVQDVNNSKKGAIQVQLSDSTSTSGRTIAGIPAASLPDTFVIDRVAASGEQNNSPTNSLNNVSKNSLSSIVVGPITTEPREISSETTASQSQPPSTTPTTFSLLDDAVTGNLNGFEPVHTIAQTKFATPHQAANKFTPAGTSTNDASFLASNDGNPSKNAVQTMSTLPKIVPLPKFQPATGPSTQATSGVAANTELLTGEHETTVQSPSWYDAKFASSLESTMLPEWFNKSAPHRTPSSYVTAREQIIDVARRNSNKYITATAVRRCVAGDAGSLLRLHSFLVTWGFINGSAFGESMPVVVGLRATSDYLNAENDMKGDAETWTEHTRKLLVTAVVSNSSSKRSRDSVGTEEETKIDWIAVSKDVGGGVTPFECQREFLSLPMDEFNMLDTTTGSNGSGNATTIGAVSLKRKREMVEGFMYELTESVRPEVLSAVTEAALKATNDVKEAQNASIQGIVAGQAMMRAREEEESISCLLQEILEQRILKLENRTALLDDVEGMLEAERMALELERRDLYTARCRHWFGKEN